MSVCTSVESISSARSNSARVSVGSIEVSLSGLAVAAIAGIALNAVLPGKDYEFGEDEKGDTSVNFQV